MFRIATVAVVAPLFIGITLYGSFKLFAVFMALLVVACFIEYAGMAEGKGIKIFRIQGLIAATILPLAFITSSPSVVYAALFLITLSLLIAGFNHPENGSQSAIFTLFGILYISLPFTSALLLLSLPEGNRLFLLICFATWGADTGAYYIGKNFGKTKIAPKISPKKTVEGFFGGLLFSPLTCLVAAYFLFDSLPSVLIISAGLIGGLIGPVGDLAESMLKRFFGAKDSGNILPGHGGILDRADALMMTTPVFYIFLFLKDGLF